MCMKSNIGTYNNFGGAPRPLPCPRPSVDRDVSYRIYDNMGVAIAFNSLEVNAPPKRSNVINF